MKAKRKTTQPKKSARASRFDAEIADAKQRSAQYAAGNIDWLTIHGARQNNLKNIDAHFPLGRFIAVTGVSGSGKSSLVNDILRSRLAVDLNGVEKLTVGDHDNITGHERLDKVIAIDQSPIGRTPRSNPATYIKAFDEIRKLYTALPDAKVRGYKPGRFSFNVQTGSAGGGRCEACEGNGANKMEMDFLADIWVECPVCEGKRFSRETLQIYFKHKHISDVLNMDVQDALDHFANVPKIARMLQTLHDVGLDYLKLGQSSTTLSGGEAQRIKLARELVKRSTGRTLYVLDEPTTGLHFEDIRRLLAVLHGFVDTGNTVVVIEHNLDVIKTADWVIDLGPEGGAGGGNIVAAGTPEHVAQAGASYTGDALAGVLGIRRKKKRNTQTATAATRDRLQPLNGKIKNITVMGARQHNLKGINVEIPREKITVVTGVSGSGKTSLAMDTVYAEGQRRYVESLSSYARQFLGAVQKPKVDHVYGLSPAIAIEQKSASKSPRSTVGTVTEIYDYMRVLWTRIGLPHCPQCNVPIGTQSSDEIIDKVMSLAAGVRVLLMSPIERTGTETYDQLFAREKANGFTRVRIDGKVLSLDEEINIDHRRRHVVEIVVDRVILRANQRSRITDSVEQALSMGSGVMIAHVLGEENKKGKDFRFSQLFACDKCSTSYEELTPHHFSFNSMFGWCETCEGLGEQLGADVSAIVVKPTKSLIDGAILGWGENKASQQMMRILAEHLGFDPESSWNDLADADRRALLYGLGDTWLDAGRIWPGCRVQWKGFYPAIDEATKAGWKYRKLLEHLTTNIPCSACQGSRLRPESAAVRLKRKSIHDVCRLPLDEALKFFTGLKLDPREKRVAGELLHEIRSRLKFLVDVGLDYVSLHRSAPTLSGGESQRIRLASQLGSGLTGVLYVLDEPTIGLHPRDNQRLISALARLRDLGNTLLMVEHDREVIDQADHVLDIGPGAGRYGGTVTADGSPAQVKRSGTSLTGKYLSGKEAIPVPTNRRPIDGQTKIKWLEVSGARANNLKDIDVRFPLGRFTAVTGVSGSGKSSLVSDILYPALASRIHRARLTPAGHDEVRGFNHIDKVINVDQSPIGSTPSSNPATYTGVFDQIRELFAKMPESKIRGYSANRFSFNRPGGRCDDCEGMGQVCIEMHFLPDVWVECETCNGKRYAAETLEVTFKGKTIADVLEMSVVEALDLFSEVPKVRRMLDTLNDVGLGYVPLGQSAPTLSGGEAQRVKLAAELGRPSTGKTVYILDEPTTGLHFDDLKKLLAVLNRLADLGNTVICIEHHIDVIKTADWVIDLGPEGGDQGGTLVAVGTPEAISDITGSHTGIVLKAALEAGPHEKRILFDAKAHAAAILDAAKPMNLKAAGVDVKMPWMRDGRSWHTGERVSEEGDPIEWEGEMLGWLVDRLEKIDGFKPTNWNHRSRVEITASHQPASWFLHALTGNVWLLDLAFRVPAGKMKLREIEAKLSLPALDDREDLPIYGQWERVQFRRARADFDELRLYVHDLVELNTPAFHRFLDEAAKAYLDHCRSIESDPGQAEPWKENGKQWHLSQKSIRRTKHWQPTTLVQLTGALSKAVPGVQFEWNQKVLVRFYRGGTKDLLGRIVTNMGDAIRLELRTAQNHFTPTRVEGLGIETDIDRGKLGGDLVRFKLRKMGDVNGKLLSSVLREADASLREENGDG